MPADIASLLSVAPVTAAGFVGQQQANDEDMQALKQQELAQLISARLQEQQFKAQSQPFELDKLRLGNEGTSQDNRTKGLTNQKTERTMDSDVDNINSKNKMDTYQRVGTHLGSFASAIDDNPDMPPHMAVTQAMQNAGLSPGQAEAMMKRYARVPPGQLAKRLKEDSDKLLRETSGYAQAVDTNNADNQNRITTTRMNNESAQKVANIQANAQIAKSDRAAELKQNVEQRIAAAKSARERYSILVDAAVKADQAGDKVAANQYMIRADAQEKQAQAETARATPAAGGVDVGNMAGVPTVPVTPIAPPVRPGGPAPTPQPTPNEQLVPVIHPDGRRGSIPASRLQEALQAGFKRVQ